MKPIKASELSRSVLDKITNPDDRKALGLPPRTDTAIPTYTVILETTGKTRKASRRKMKQTEIDFNQDILGGRGMFEVVMFRLPGGSRYTPDFFTVEDGVATFYEVKGSYRLHSHGRALTAFRECRAHFTMFRFRWFEKSANGFIEKHKEHRL